MKTFVHIDCVIPCDNIWGAFGAARLCFFDHFERVYADAEEGCGEISTNA